MSGRVMKQLNHLVPEEISIPLSWAYLHRRPTEEGGMVVGELRQRRLKKKLWKSLTPKQREKRRMALA